MVGVRTYCCPGGVLRGQPRVLDSLHRDGQLHVEADSPPYVNSHKGSAALYPHSCMSSWQQQALIEAPVEEVWHAVADPQAYARWAAGVIEVTGAAKLAQDARFQQLTKSPFFPADETTFRVEAMEEMREIKLRCEKTGYYSHWVLTPAQDSTFMDVEIGVDPTALQYRLYFGAMGKRHFRRLTEESLDGLRRLLAEGREGPRHRGERLPRPRGVRRAAAPRARGLGAGQAAGLRARGLHRGGGRHHRPDACRRARPGRPTAWSTWPRRSPRSATPTRSAGERARARGLCRGLRAGGRRDSCSPRPWSRATRTARSCTSARTSPSRPPTAVRSRRARGSWRRPASRTRSSGRATSTGRAAGSRRSSSSGCASRGGSRSSGRATTGGTWCTSTTWRPRSPGRGARGPDGTYHVADDEPIKYYDFVSLAAEALGVGEPRRIPAWLAARAAGRDPVRGGDALGEELERPHQGRAGVGAPLAERPRGRAGRRGAAGLAAWLDHRVHPPPHRRHRRPKPPAHLGKALAPRKLAPAPRVVLPHQPRRHQHRRRERIRLLLGHAAAPAARLADRRRKTGSRSSPRGRRGACTSGRARGRS